jgi:hypothetical protein
VALSGAVLAAVALRLEPPAPRPAGPPASEFSAVRALALLGSLLGDGAPHPVGSEANRRVQERILAEMERLGLRPEVQEAFACGRSGMCATVRNLLARIPGERPGRAVLLMAHHDSVPAGPGAGDDGSGVAAALEVARAILSGAPLPRPTIVLLDDGEEGVLIGAQAFLDGHPWAREVGAIVNLEARGTSGPSLMFQTTGDDGWLVRILAGALPQPAASSLFPAVYRLLPNDTDLSVFEPLRVPGVNFAFIGGASRYHTPRDDLAHLDPGSLQHQGENALAMVRALAGADLEDPPRGNAVFFDVLGLFVVRWPERASLPLALLAAVLALAGTWVRTRRERLGSAALGLLAFLAVPVSAALLALAARPVTGAGPFVAHPGAAKAAFLAAGAVAVFLAAALFRRAGPQGIRTGAAVGWAALAVATAALLPGASYAFVFPALAAATVLAPSLARPEHAAADLAVAAAAGLILFPVALLVQDALGVGAGPIAAAVAALALSPLAPLAAALPQARRWLPAAAGGGVFVLALGIAGAVPRHSPDAPEHVVVLFHQDADSGKARWLVHAASGRLPPPMRAFAAFGDREELPAPWGKLRPSFAAEAAPLSAPGPVLLPLEVAAEGGRLRARMRLSSPRGASDAFLLFPPEAVVETVSLGGTRVPPAYPRARRWFGGWQLYRCLTLPPGGIDVEVVLGEGGPREVVVADQSQGVPAAGAALVAARPPWASTVQEGDATLFTRRVRLGPH